MKEKTEVRDAFLKQLGKNHPIKEETRRDFSGKTIFDKEYENGDVVLWFMLQTTGEESVPSDMPFESPLADPNSIYTEPTVTFNMCSVTRNELDKFDEEYELVRMGSDTLPIFEHRKDGK